MTQNEYIHCPRCGSTEITDSDYEDENGEDDIYGRRCGGCSWEGDLSELVSVKEDRP